jgi:hypothetical protein
MKKNFIFISVIATVFLFVNNAVSAPNAIEKTILDKIDDYKTKIMEKSDNYKLSPFGFIIGFPLLLLSLALTFQGLVGSKFNPMGVLLLILGIIGDIISILIILRL